LAKLFKPEHKFCLFAGNIIFVLSHKLYHFVSKLKILAAEIQIKHAETICQAAEIEIRATIIKNTTCRNIKC